MARTVRKRSPSLDGNVWAGVYDAVAEAVKSELYKHKPGSEPKPYGDWREELMFGAPLTVPADMLPRFARPALLPGRPMPVVVVSADDRVVPRPVPQTAREWVEGNDL